MPDQLPPPEPSSPHPQRHDLSDISHLFLSNIRDQAGGGRQPPRRKPPARGGIPDPAHSLDLTPEEFARAFGEAPAEIEHDQSERSAAAVPPVVAIIGAHLNGRQFDRAKEYARHLAAQGARIGLIELDASEFRVMCFDKYGGETEAPITPDTSYDPRRMSEALEELSWDVARWLLVLPQARVPEARGLLRECRHWALLSTCDHDGVISAYRTLKGLTDLWPGGITGRRPELSLALLDAMDDEQAGLIGSKLQSVCRQFLRWPIEEETQVVRSAEASEHLVMCARPMRDKSQLATAPQWEIVMDFIRRSSDGASHSSQAVEELAPDGSPDAAESPDTSFHGFEPVMKEIPTSRLPSSNGRESSSAASGAPVHGSEEASVIDLPHSEDGESAIVMAILKHRAQELVECPIAPPMCPRARLAVSRDHRIVMLAVSREAMNDLGTIGQAYRWLQENQALIGMAVPQLAIDPQQPPRLSLLIDQNDSAARTLRPMFQGDHVTVETYRKLRWGDRTGLLLEAA